MQPQSSGEALPAWIKARIAEHGLVPLSQFMEWALYHPQYGYYTRGPAIGPRGDFTTSPEASPEFGRLLARHVADIDALLGGPEQFNMVECGPGNGTLAADMLAALQAEYPQLYNRLRYRLVEISPALTLEQQARLLPQHAAKVGWAISIEQLPQGLYGAIVGNEFIDAFPVHLLENREGQIQEQYVGLSPNNSLELVYGAPSDPRLAQFIQDYNLRLLPGERIEINLGSAEWLKQATHLLERGVVTLIDYGDTQPARYSAARREGTLLGYYGGAVTANVLSHPGMQDLTALVDFTALRDEAQQAGFDVLGLTRQAAFLVGLGLGLGTDATSHEEAGGGQAQAAQRRGRQALVSMEGLGKFHVLLLGKGVDRQSALQSLSGLKYIGIL